MRWENMVRNEIQWEDIGGIEIKWHVMGQYDETHWELLFNSQMQQTPKPDAQDPLAVPPLLLHSSSVKQVPMLPSLAEQALFLNLTIWKTLRAGEGQGGLVGNTKRSASSYFLQIIKKTCRPVAWIFIIVRARSFTIIIGHLHFASLSSPAGDIWEDSGDPGESGAAESTPWSMLVGWAERGKRRQETAKRRPSICKGASG